MNAYRVYAEYNDVEIAEKKLRNEAQDISMATSRHTLTVLADDMKKAYDTAIRYLPAGAEITMIELEYRPVYGKPVRNIAPMTSKLEGEF